MGNADRPLSEKVILLVEDDLVLGELLGLLLRQRTGARTVTSPSERGLFALLRDAYVDAVVIDGDLRGDDGWSLPRRLKADPETASILTVGYSGIGKRGRPLALAAGFDAYVGKDEGSDRLVHVLVRLLASASSPGLS